MADVHAKDEKLPVTDEKHSDSQPGSSDHSDLPVGGDGGQTRLGDVEFKHDLHRGLKVCCRVTIMLSTPRLTMFLGSSHSMLYYLDRVKAGSLTRPQTMIAIGGAIGTGLIIGTGKFCLFKLSTLKPTLHSKEVPSPVPVPHLSSSHTPSLVSWST